MNGARRKDPAPWPNVWAGEGRSSGGQVPSLPCIWFTIQSYFNAVTVSEGSMCNKGLLKMPFLGSKETEQVQFYCRHLLSQCATMVAQTVKAYMETRLSVLNKMPKGAVSSENIQPWGDFQEQHWRWELSGFYLESECNRGKQSSKNLFESQEVCLGKIRIMARKSMLLYPEHVC